MAALTIRSGPWSPGEVEHFLGEATIPLRLASNGQTYPLVQSLWFRYDDAALWCCTRADSVLAMRLRRDPHCAFEVSADAPPYRGVRGRGIAELLDEGAATTLPTLLDRYLGSTSTQLAQWLLSRLDEEVVLRISSLVVTSWDYSSRMATS